MFSLGFMAENSIPPPTFLDKLFIFFWLFQFFLWKIFTTLQIVFLGAEDQSTFFPPFLSLSTEKWTHSLTCVLTSMSGSGVKVTVALPVLPNSSGLCGTESSHTKLNYIFWKRNRNRTKHLNPKFLWPKGLNHVRATSRYISHVRRNHPLERDLQIIWYTCVLVLVLYFRTKLMVKGPISLYMNYIPTSSSTLYHLKFGL